MLGWYTIGEWIDRCMEKEGITQAPMCLKDRILTWLKKWRGTGK